MPSSKRNRIIPTSVTKKKRKELSRKLHSTVETAAAQFSYIWVFSVTNMRNNIMKDMRSELSDSRICMGKTKLMGHALGGSPETEVVNGVNGLVQYLKGDVGLLFTDRDPETIEEFVNSWVVEDFARAGTVANRDFVVPRGELKTVSDQFGGGGEPLPMSIEPTLRKLGIPTKVVRGKVVLEEIDGDEDGDGYLVCKEGVALDSRQTSILKIFGQKMANFEMSLIALFDKDKATVKEFTAMEIDG